MFGLLLFNQQEGTKQYEIFSMTGTMSVESLWLKGSRS